MTNSESDLQHWNAIELQFVSITIEQLWRAQAEIASCQACNVQVQTPFDWLLRDVTQEKGHVDYIIPEPAKCPRCGADVYEKTLVEPESVIERENLAG